MSFNDPVLDVALKAWEDSLSQAEIIAAGEYRGSHEVFNRILWDDADIKNHPAYRLTLHARIPALTTAISKGVLPHDVVVYRGQEPPPTVKHVIRGFASTSTTIDVAWQFAKQIVPDGTGIILEIPLPRGYPVGYLNRTEFELLIDFGLSLEVTYARLYQGVQVYEARLI